MTIPATDDIDELLASLGFDDEPTRPADSRLVSTVDSSRPVSADAVIEGRALRLVATGLDQLESAVSAGDVGVGTLTRVVEIAHRVGGMDARRAAAVAARQPHRLTSIVIRNPGDPEPPPTADGESRIVIDLSGRDAKNATQVIEGRATRTEEN